QVAAIAGNGSRMMGVLEVGDAPFTFTYSPQQRRLYVGHLGSRKVYVIRDTVSGIEEHTASARRHCPLLVVRPNPFRLQTRIAIGRLEHFPEGLEVHSCDGRLVARLAVADRKGGSTQYQWDGRDLDGCEAPAGIYLVAPVRGPGMAVQVVKTEG
ncbi:MAG: hypothetical protein JSU73_01015, partial [candidate division WOR-3 bacterium]